MDTEPIKGMLTLDAEDWDHANYPQLSGKRNEILLSVRERKYAMDSNIDLWVSLLEEVGAKSTCFILGEFAERFPDSIRKLARAGHEMASHGWSHDLVYQMSREQFRESLKKSIGILGDLIGVAPKGFRAPCWSVDQRTLWFCEELVAQKIIYNSSLFPLKTPYFGQKGGAYQPFQEGQIFRLPVSILKMGFLRVPFANGAFFRWMPLQLIEHGLRQAAATRQAVMLVLHPRELDPDHPGLPINFWQKAAHYAYLHHTVPKLRYLLRRFQWTSVSELHGARLEELGEVRG